MEWLSYTIKTETEAEEAVSAMLGELGLDSLEIIEADPLSAEDKALLFLAPDAELQPDAAVPEGELQIRFYLHSALDPEASAAPQDAEDSDDSYTIHDRRYSPEEIRAIEAAVADGLEKLKAMGIVRRAELESGISREEDWRDRWKQYAQPIEANGILICPAWSEVPEEARERIGKGELKLLRLEMGTAFGTGAHASTRLCLDGMAHLDLIGKSLLDIGTGSGVLALSAFLSGAERVTATEVDPACEDVVFENLRINGFDKKSSRFRLLMGDILTDPSVQEGAAGKYDVVTANILAPVILKLAAPGAADRYVKTDGVFIGSGIINTRADEVAEALAANPAWTDIRTDFIGEWAAVTAVRT